MTDNIKHTLHYFFPGESFHEKTVKEEISNGNIIFDKTDMLPFLQTALFDDKILEVELDGIMTTYFSRLLDDAPELISGELEGKTVYSEPEYEVGEYLLDLDHLITLPLEPGMGNLHLRHSRSIVLRMFTSNFAVEFGTTFEDMVKIRSVPVLRLSYPALLRKVTDAREFRAKIPESYDFVISIAINEDLPPLNTTPVNISVRGMAFAVTKMEHKLFRLNNKYTFKLFVEDELRVVVDGTIEHLGKVRKRSTIQYLCGVEFDLAKKHIAGAVESIVAAVQRAHLKELAELSENSGYNLIA